MVITIIILALILAYSAIMVMVEGFRKPKYTGKINWFALIAYLLGVIASIVGITITLME